MDSAPQPHVSAADEIGAKVEAQMTRLLFQSAGFGLFSNFVLAALLVLGLADSIPWQSKGLWFAAMMTLSVVRLGLNLRYQRRELSVDQHRRWRMMFIIGTGLSGLLWGWAAWCFYREDQMSSSVLLVMILIGLNAGAARSLASVLSCSQVYVATTLLPLGAVCLSLSSPNWFLFGITVTYALFLLRTTSLLHDDLAKLHTLILQNESYVQELRAAKASAEDSNRIKGDFLATISHEIRTPMNGVIGMLQILRESSLTPEQLSQVNIATGSADTLLRLLNDVLDFSKVESGKLEFESIPFSPAESLREVSALLCSRATDKGLGFNLHLPSGDPLYVLGDSVRLKQVLLNLTGNAIKFTESGRVDLAMSISARDKKSATMHFSIRDTGIGIDRSTQAKLFQVFSQGDSSTTRRFGGSGLGLAISQRLVTLMGSQIKLTSTPKQGSIFEFTLTLPISHVQNLSAPSSIPVTDGALHGRVLVAEDDPINQRVIDMMLTRLGLDHELVSTGTEAVRRGLDEPWAAILMDCHMPSMDGYDATRELRRQLQGRRLPIIAITANAMSADREACLAAGMDDFLAKPVRLDDLQHCLRRWLPTHSVSDTAL